MNIDSMNEYLTSTPITVGQLSNIIFQERPLLAEYQFNDVIRGVQGRYSLNPKWLTYLTLGYVGPIVPYKNQFKVKDISAEV